MLPLELDPIVERMLSALNRIYPMSKGLQDDIKAVLRYKKLQKGEHLLKDGEVCRNVYFILRGYLRLYYYTLDDNEVSTWFMFEKDVCVSIDSFYLQVESYEFIVAEEETEVFYISYDELNKLYNEHLEFNYIGRVLTISYLVRLCGQLKQIRRLPTDQRYDALLEREPELIQRVALKHIATSLSMEETSLSRSLDPRKKKKKRRNKK